MGAIYLGDFRLQKPAFRADHAHSVAWLAAAHAEAEGSATAEDKEAFAARMRKWLERFGCSAEAIAERGYELSDFSHFDFDAMRIFHLGRNRKGASMEERMAFFREKAEAVLEGFYPAAQAAGSTQGGGPVEKAAESVRGEEPPAHLIHVTCTGYVSPSAAQTLVSRRGWHRDTGVLHAYHMGCYAALPAVRMGEGLLFRLAGAKPGSRVDIVHTELCTLHLDPSRHEPEQLVVQSLFADGHIRYSLSDHPLSAAGFEVLGIREEILPGTEGAMSWVLTGQGMAMTLSREVPDLIASSIESFLLRMFGEAGFDYAAEAPRALFAVHPGGPRIVDLVAGRLKLAPFQTAASRRILFRHGNMSSATLPHIWADMAGDEDAPPGVLVAALAFGPGLSVQGCLLRKRPSPTLNPEV